MIVSRNQLNAMAGWLETTESANDTLADEIWHARQTVSGNGRASVSSEAIAEALYYAENASESGAWTRADQRAFDQLWRRLEAR